MGQLLASAIRRVRPAPLASALKRLLRIKRTVIDTEHGRFYVDPASDLGVRLAEGDYEPWMRGHLRTYLPKGGVFVDVGANEGFFSVLAAPIASRVIAVEPQLRLIPVITENLRLNGATNVAIESAAISDHAGLTKLYLAPDMNNGASGLTNATRFKVETQSVATITLAELFKRHNIDRADFVKIDVEGHEYEAVTGSPALFTDKRIVAISIEMHPEQLAERGRTDQDIARFLASVGYTFNGAVWVA